MHKLGKSYSEYEFVKIPTVESLAEDERNNQLIKEAEKKFPFNYKGILPEPEEAKMK